MMVRCDQRHLYDLRAWSSVKSARVAPGREVQHNQQILSCVRRLAVHMRKYNGIRMQPWPNRLYSPGGPTGFPLVLEGRDQRPEHRDLHNRRHARRSPVGTTVLDQHGHLSHATVERVLHRAPNVTSGDVLVQAERAPLLRVARHKPSRLRLSHARNTGKGYKHGTRSYITKNRHAL